MSPTHQRHHRGFLGIAIAAAILGTVRVTALVGQDSVRVSVEVDGVDETLERNVLALLELARAADGGKLSRAKVERLHERADQDIRTALEPFGFYRPTIDKTLERVEDRLTARYHIDPGPAVRIRSLSIELSGPGAERPEFTAAVAKFPLEKGDTLSHVLYEAGKIVLLTVASDSGYLDATFDSAAVLVDGGDAAADVVIRFRTGERFKFGPVRFEQRILDDGFLRSRVPFKQGQPWRQDKITELQVALAEDPYWAQVEVVPLRAEARGLEVPVQVNLEPKKAAAYEFGAGYGTDTGPRGRVNGQFRRINRRGHYANGEISIATREQRFEAEYNIPAFGHPTGTLTFQGGYARLDPTTSTSNTATIGARLLRKRIGWRETLSLAYQRESFTVGVDSGVTNLLIGGASWERTRTNDRIYPTRGLRLQTSIQGSQRGIAAGLSFAEVRGAGKAVYGFGPKARVLTRVEVARVFTSRFRDLPPTLRLFAGGDQSVRGFGYRTLGPTDSLGNVIGGPVLMTGSLEADYRFMNRWAFAVFTDVGNAANRLTLADLEQSVGVGIRFLAPIGMIRLDAAFGISRGDRPFRIHLSIGPDL